MFMCTEVDVRERLCSSPCSKSFIYRDIFSAYRTPSQLMRCVYCCTEANFISHILCSKVYNPFQCLRHTLLWSMHASYYLFATQIRQCSAKLGFRLPGELHPVYVFLWHVCCDSGVACMVFRNQ